MRITDKYVLMSKGLHAQDVYMVCILLQLNSELSLTVTCILVLVMCPDTASRACLVLP